MAETNNVHDLIRQMHEERIELHKKYEATVVKTKNEVKKVPRTVKGTQKIEGNRTTPNVVKRKEEPVKLVPKVEHKKLEKKDVTKAEPKVFETKKVEKKDVTKAEPKVFETKKVEKKNKVVKTRKYASKKKTRKNLKINQRAIPIFLAIVLGGFLIYKSGVIQDAYQFLSTKYYLQKSKENISGPSLQDTMKEVPPTINIDIPETSDIIDDNVDVEYVSAELFSAGYKFNKDITPEYLKEINPVLSNNTAWIEIPGTNINYPLVYPSVENIDKVDGLIDEIDESDYNAYDFMNRYFLKHTINDVKSDWGTLYLDIYNEPLNQHTYDLDDMSVIYGHHMADKSMFTGLDNWKKDSDGSYNAEHPFGVIYTDDGLCYKVTFITSRVISGNKANILGAGNFDSVEDKQAFIDEVIAQAKRDGNFTLDSYDVDENSKFLSLVTCSYEHQNDRYVLIGVLDKQAVKDVYIDGYEIGKEKER